MEKDRELYAGDRGGCLDWTVKCDRARIDARERSIVSVRVIDLLGAYLLLDGL